MMMMMLQQSPSVLLLAASLLAALPVNADGLYTKNSPVLHVNQKTYNQLIANSNYTSIVEFYAPWCGHCQNLKPAYEKAAKNLEGLAKVAAVNCDEESNKAFCGRMGVQGFPTLKIVVPGKKPGKPRVEDYQGERSAKAIVDAVVSRIPSHVTKLTDKDVEKWLSEAPDVPKAVLFTEKGTTSALIRALAIDFLGQIKFSQIRSKESEAVERFGVEDFPTLVLLPGGDKEPIVYKGELKKKPIIEFLSQVAAPNPDPAPSAAAASSSGKSKPAKSSTKSAKPKATASVILDDEAENLKPTESPDPRIVPDDAKDSKPAQVPLETPPLNSLATAEALESACLTPKSGTCILALVPPSGEEGAEPPSPTQEALLSLAEISHRYTLRKSKLFPFYSVPAINDGAKILRDALGLAAGDGVEIIALNARRGWWRRFEGADYSLVSLDSWIDAIRLGEGHKEKLPDGVVASVEAETTGTVDHDEL